MGRLQIFEQRSVTIRTMLLAVCSHSWMENDALENRARILTGRRVKKSMPLNYNRGRGSGKECGRCKEVHRCEVTSWVWEGQRDGWGQTSRDDSEVSGLGGTGSSGGRGLRRKMTRSGENALSLRSQWPCDEMPSRCLTYGDIWVCTQFYTSIIWSFKTDKLLELHSHLTKGLLALQKH